MRIITAVMAIAMVLLLSSIALAETAAELQKTYIVQSGDWLIKIGRKVKADWKQIAKANGLKKPYLIYPDQKLIIPENRWEDMDDNPYKGTGQWAIENFDLPAEVKKQAKENIKKDKFKWLESGLKGGQKVSQVAFGPNNQKEIWTDVICSWSKTHAYAIKDYGIGDYHIVQVLKGKNWVWWIEKKPVSKTLSVVSVFKIPIIFPPVPVSIPPKEEGKEE